MLTIWLGLILLTLLTSAFFKLRNTILLLLNIMTVEFFNTHFFMILLFLGTDLISIYYIAVRKNINFVFFFV